MNDERSLDDVFRDAEIRALARTATASSHRHSKSCTQESCGRFTLYYDGVIDRKGVETCTKAGHADYAKAPCGGHLVPSRRELVEASLLAKGYTIEDSGLPETPAPDNVVPFQRPGPEPDPTPPGSHSPNDIPF